MTSFNQYIHYWEQRHTLNAGDWQTLYQLTHRYLAACSIRDFEAELGDRKSLIDDFFHDKVFATAGSEGGAPVAPGVICVYLRNYLRDRLKSAWERKRVSTDDDDHPESAYEQCGCESAEDIDEIMRDIGLTVELVSRHAQDFLTTLDENERMYLALHACADDPEALSNLAKRFRVPSYHYKAKKLGITREKGECELGYDKTAIGRWLSHSLGIELDREHSEAILAALKILCWVSLSQWEGSTP